MYPSGPPAKEPPLPGFPNRALAERDATCLEPSFSYFSKFPVNGPPHQVPQWSPYGERHPFPESSSTHNLITHLSLKVSGLFPKGVRMERDAPCLESMVNSFIYICQSLQRRSPPTKWEKTYGHCLWSLMRMEGLLTMGCDLVSQGDRLRYRYHYPSAMQPSAPYLPPRLA
jgi:hypothetical protein